MFLSKNDGILNARRVLGYQNSWDAGTIIHQLKCRRTCVGMHTISMMQIKKWYQYVAVAAVGFMLFSLCILESCNKPNQTHASASSQTGG
jgi:hypothetical protein